MRTAEELAQALDGKKCGQSWRCHCPVHQGSNRNFYITQKDDRVLVHCFAGCTQESVIDELRARGLWLKQPERGLHFTRDMAEHAFLFCCAVDTDCKSKGRESVSAEDWMTYRRYKALLAAHEYQVRQWGLA